MSLFLLKALLMSVLPFYRVEFPLDHFPKEFTYVEYESGHKTEEHDVREGDNSYTSLKTLLTEQKSGWRYDLNSYANAHVFSSKTMIINCLNGEFVVNYEEKKGDRDWVQISKDIKGACPVIRTNPTRAN